MIEHIQPAMFDQIDPGELHDLSYLIFIVTPVALGIALLAHGFGIVRTLRPHGKTVREKPFTLRTEGDLFLIDLFDIEKLKGEWRFLPLVILPAEDRDKLHQCPNVILLFV
jgi:hypothetical protein